MTNQQQRAAPSPVLLLRYLTERAFLGALDQATEQALQAELEWVQLAPNEILFRQGEQGDSLYVVIQGRLVVQVQQAIGDPLLVDEASPQQVLGEMALLTGQKRSATVYALEAAQLVKLSAAGFERLARQSPQLRTRLAESIMPRLRRQHLLGILTQLLGPLEKTALAELQQQLAWRHLAAGECLMRQGETSDAAYIVVNGRLRVTIGAAGNETEEGQFVREVGAGEIVGEIGLLTATPRTATVTAIRATTVVCLSLAGWEALIVRYPQVMVQVARIMAGRQVGVAALKPKEAVALTFALVAGDTATPVAQIAERLTATLAAWGDALYLNSTRFDEIFGVAGAAQTMPNDPLHLPITGWLSEQETRFRYIIYEGDRTWSAWTQRCTQQADRILIVKSANGDPTPDPLEQALVATQSLIAQELVLLQADNCVQPTGTAPWLQPRRVKTHHHLRFANASDWQRLARRITGRAVGLVFSGGGARGNAHIGVLRALTEQNIPVDIIGGASAGAIAAGLYTLNLDYTKTVQAARHGSAKKRIFDYTLPLTSLLASAKVTTLLQQWFGDSCIEDLWIPYFCVSCNLSRATIRVHEQGALWLAVRASLAIPGIFSPVLDQGDVLVDASVINNFPADVLRRRYQPGRVIGVNLTPKEGFRGYNFGPSLSGWQLLWQRFNPSAKSLRAPSLMSILTRSHAMHGIQSARATQGLVDLLIEPEVAHIRLDNYEAFDEVSEIGYQAACKALAGWEKS